MATRSKPQEVLDLIDAITQYRMFGLNTPESLKLKWKELMLKYPPEREV